jgi:hypothetical protein
VREPPEIETHASGRNTRDVAAFWLSLVPGLGHLYKGHLLLGGLIFFVIGPLVLGIALSMIIATLGLSMLYPLVFMILVMFHAYDAEDRRERTIEHAKTGGRALFTH